MDKKEDLLFLNFNYFLIIEFINFFPQDDAFALIVTLSKMKNLEMPALRGRNRAQLAHVSKIQENFDCSMQLWYIDVGDIMKRYSQLPVWTRDR